MIQQNQNDYLWGDNPVVFTSEANFIWSIANKLRGTVLPDKYGDAIIPMTVLRRLIAMNMSVLKNNNRALVGTFDVTVELLPLE